MCVVCSFFTKNCSLVITNHLSHLCTLCQQLAPWLYVCVQWQAACASSAVPLLVASTLSSVFPWATNTRIHQDVLTYCGLPGIIKGLLVCLWKTYMLFEAVIYICWSKPLLLSDCAVVFQLAEGLKHFFLIMFSLCKNIRALNCFNYLALNFWKGLICRV